MNVNELHQKLSNIILHGDGDLKVAFLNNDCDFGENSCEIERVEYTEDWKNNSNFYADSKLLHIELY